jgi:hypothetical protein
MPFSCNWLILRILPKHVIQAIITIFLAIKTIILAENNRRKVFNSQILFNFFDEQGRYRRRSDGCSSCRAYF